MSDDYTGILVKEGTEYGSENWDEVRFLTGMFCVRFLGNEFERPGREMLASGCLPQRGHVFPRL